MAGVSHRIVLRPYPTDYVYIHFHPERPNEVVYVGRGSGCRAWCSDRRSKLHRLWMREWQAEGYSPDKFVRVEFDGLTPQQAEKREKQLIALYRKKGHLLFNGQLNKGNIRPHGNRFLPDGPQRDTKGKYKR
jgi:hypothetical protein